MRNQPRHGKSESLGFAKTTTFAVRLALSLPAAIGWTFVMSSMAGHFAFAGTENAERPASETCSIDAGATREGATSEIDCAQSAESRCYRTAPTTYHYRAEGEPEMCQAFLQYLNKTCYEGPMVCGIHFPPDSKFSTPEWRPLNLKKNMDLLERLVRGRTLRLERFNPGAQDRSWNLLYEALKSDEGRTHAFLAVGRVDIFNRGEPETVYKLTLNSCSSARSETFMLDPVVYIEKHAKVLENEEWRERAKRGEEPFPGAHVLNAFPVNLFTFGGVTYEFRWSPEPWVRKIAWEVSSGFDEPLVGARTACAFDYIGDQQINKNKEKRDD